MPEEEADPTSVERLFHDAESVESYESDSTESMYSTQSLPENESPQVRAHRQWGNRDESGMATPGIISRIEEVLYSPRSPEWGEVSSGSYNGADGKHVLASFCLEACHSSLMECADAFSPALSQSIPVFWAPFHLRRPAPSRCTRPSAHICAQPFTHIHWTSVRGTRLNQCLVLAWSFHRL